LPLTFDVEFEIFPPFELLPPSGFTLADKPVAVTAEQVEARIADLRKRNATLEDKGGAAAEAGDTVTFDFEGRLDGTVFPGGSAQGQRIEVGAGQFLKDFDTQFPGIAAGQTKSFDVTFPADYGEATLAGKTAQFTVTAHKVEKAVPAELNAGFFKQFGAVSTEAELRDHIRAQLEKEQERAHLNGLQQALADQIRAQYGFDVPETSVDELLHRYEHELAESQPDAVQDPQKLEALKEERRKVILGDLRLGFVANAYADKSGIQVDPAQLRQRFMLQAYMMQQNPSELLKTGYGEQMLSQIRQQMLIAKTLGHLVHVVLGKEVPPEFAPGAPPAEGDDDPSGRELEDHDHEGHDHAAHAHEEHAH
jgi:trigger factor